MAQFATVTAVTGRVLLIPTTGEPRVLAVGDTIQAGDTVRPAPGASVQLALDDGQTMTLGDDQALLMGADTPVPADPAATEAVQAVLDVLERGGDLDELEAAAAGLGGGGGGDGSSFVRLLRISEGVSPLAYEFGTELAPTIDEPLLSATPVEQPQEPPPLVGNLVLHATPEVREGGLGITYWVILDQPAPTDMEIRLSNGKSITLPEGATEASILVPVQGDDPYVDGETIVVQVNTVQGGGFDQLVIDDAGAVTLVTDTLTPTGVTLTAGTVTEDEAGVTFTATLSHPGQTDVTVVTSVGNILIPAGQVSGSLVVNTANPDVYVDPGSVTATVTNLLGGNFELVDYSQATATASITDTIDTTYLVVGDVTASEGGTATLSVSVGAPVTGSDLLITLSNGATVTIPVGQSVGVSTVFNVANAEDPYVDAGEYSVGVLSVSGGNYEALNTSSTGTVTFLDTINPTGVTLGDVTAFEGGTATLTATVGAPVTGSDLVITLDNGATVTIPVGQSTATSTPFQVANAEDPYVDAGQYSVGIQGVTGGNYEQLDLSGTATVTVDDTPTPTAVTLITADVPETATEVVFTVKVAAPPQSAATAQVQVGTTTYNVTLDASGEGTLRIPLAEDDVYLDTDQLAAKVLGVTGGGYELINLAGATATAHILEVYDTTTFTLSAPDTVAESLPGQLSTIRYTVTLDHPPETLLTVQLSNNATVQIAPGATTGYVDVPLPVGVLSIEPVSITGHTGGNYEQTLYQGVAATDVDSLPVGTPASIALQEGGAASGTAILAFNAGADTMDPDAYGFVNPSVSVPIVSGLLDSETLQWTLINPTTLQATTSQGSLVLTLTGGSSTGVLVAAVLNGNLLHTADAVTVSNVLVSAQDTDQQSANVPVEITIADDQPSVLFSTTVGSASAPEGIYTGQWVADQGVDDTAPVVSGVSLLSATVDGQPAQTTFTDYDPDTGLGSGTLVSGAYTIPFTFALANDGTYTVDLGSATKQVVITAGEYSGTIAPSGPVTEYIIQYLDASTNTTATATASALPAGTALTLYEYGQSTPRVVTATGGGINASGTGVGISSNVLESYVDKGVYTTEALRYNPEGQVSAITLDFTGGGANDFGGTKTDVLYLTLVGEAPGQTQTILLDSRYGDFTVQGSVFTPITSTAYTGGALSNYTVNLPEGWTGIAEVQVVPGFYTDGSTVNATDLKLAFGFATTTTVDVDMPVQMNFVATVTDADLDTASSAFSLLTYAGTLATGTEGADVITGTPAADTYSAGAGDDLLVASAGGDQLAGGAGLDTVSYALAASGVTVDLGAGLATPSEGGLSDTLSGLENVTGSPYADSLTGDAGDNVLDGGLGDDVLAGAGGFDTASYRDASAGVIASLAGQGDAIPDTSGGAGADTLSDITHLAGSAYNDVLTGDAGANVLSGGGGDDVLRGGPGDDDLTGGPGSDTFDYDAGDTGHDVIHDFTLAPVDDGGDRIDLSDMLDLPEANAQALEPYLSFASNGNGHAVLHVATGADLNGDGIPDSLQSIELDGISLAQLYAYTGLDDPSTVELIDHLLKNGNLHIDD